MKRFQQVIAPCLYAAILVFGMTGCKYDVAEPPYNKPLVSNGTPVITQVSPTSATPGVNTITIQGQNFAAYPDSNFVYFGQTKSDVISYTSTSITVRRPNLVTAGCTIVIAPGNAITPAKSATQYAVTPVMEKYGNFVGNLQLSVVAVDKKDNLYAVLTASKKVVRIYPDGRRDTVGTILRDVTDARVGPDGYLYLIGLTSKYVQGINLNVTPSPGVVSQYKTLAPQMRCGDFDTSGYFYAGGAITADLQIAKPGFASVTKSGLHPAEDIAAVRVFNGYLYVAGRATNKPTKIWRHSISPGGVLGAAELVAAFDSTSFSARTVKSLTFSTDGKMFIGTDSPDPLLVADISSLPASLDLFYKGILPSSIKHMNWGMGNYLYMITNDPLANPAQDWNVYKVNIGSTGTR
ncbi:MAG TPA: IPT/TIG domain-containing protein [Bacteroidota bacterium]|nr:IPT/TIG domain-containing protein [Bacteroidota bacterium]